MKHTSDMTTSMFPITLKLLKMKPPLKIMLNGNNNFEFKKKKKGFFTLA